MKNRPSPLQEAPQSAGARDGHASRAEGGNGDTEASKLVQAGVGFLSHVSHNVLVIEEDSRGYDPFEEGIGQFRGRGVGRAPVCRGGNTALSNRPLAGQDYLKGGIFGRFDRSDDPLPPPPMINTSHSLFFPSEFMLPAV